MHVPQQMQLCLGKCCYIALHRSVGIQTGCTMHASSCSIRLFGCRAQKEAAHKEKEVGSGKLCDLQLATIPGFSLQWYLV